MMRKMRALIKLIIQKINLYYQLLNIILIYLWIRYQMKKIFLIKNNQMLHQNKMMLQVYIKTNLEDMRLQNLRQLL